MEGNGVGLQQGFKNNSEHSLIRLLYFCINFFWLCLYFFYNYFSWLLVTDFWGGGGGGDERGWRSATGWFIFMLFCAIIIQSVSLPCSLSLQGAEGTPPLLSLLVSGSCFFPIGFLFFFFFSICSCCSWPRVFLSFFIYFSGLSFIFIFFCLDDGIFHACFTWASDHLGFHYCYHLPCIQIFIQLRHLLSVPIC